VLQYNATTGAYVGVFVAAGSGGLSGPDHMTFGPDGNLYVSSANTNQVLEYNGTTGAFLGTFVTSGSGGLSGVRGIAFDPSGSYLFVASSGSGQVLKYNAQTGAYVGVAASGLSSPSDVKFGADGLLYVLVQGANRIERFTESGTYVDDYAPVGSAGLSEWNWMNFGPNGDLYVDSHSSNQIYQFGTENEALFTVTLSTPFAEPVTVNYATADGTAHAGTNYTATSGTLTFAPGVTTQTIRVPILDSGSQTTPLTFTVNLSSPQVATLSQSQATGTIEPSDQAAKFYVVNNAGPLTGGNHATFKYQANGTEQAPFFLSSSDLDPYGIAANPTGTKEWVVDRNGNVYVYSSGGTLLGSWTPGGLPAGVSLEGIATDGTNIWILDATSNKVFYYAGAASLLSGSQNATSSFKLNKSDNGPNNLVTDGKSIWVVDGNDLKVFKYTVAGKLLGSWSIDPGEIDPTGITVNPNNPSDIWIVDAYTHEVYDYASAAGRTSGKQNASATFALAAGDSNPYGIADPPTADLLLTRAALPVALSQRADTAFTALSSAGPFALAAMPFSVTGASGSVLAGSRAADSDAAFIAALQRIETEAQLAQWKSWSDVYSVLQTEEQAVLADLFALEDALAPGVVLKRS
jgi:sugar lactone lactonase YvrE